ncbi:thioredoxin domain-containing protein [Actinokineospora auranticolor]|uniref:Protein-disulfide isomerase n=1 Tax=Actinokineospora auranticolor TaxID=155976 RepID=A0A2S6GUC7_9PSEU|nr:thioredoxin domain-containing protein [Actinokineospora auranticolor]PPK68793.1 protein-disulfide isomerase [Actinokineospora auranticolor]
MGGAERSARKRRQGAQTGAGARPTGSGKGAVAAARKSGVDRKTAIGIVVVLVIAVAVVGGVIFTRSQKDDTSGQAIAVKNTGVEVPAVRDGAAVLVGKDAAKVTVDVYEDFLCPACGSFESAYGASVEEKLAAGEIKVRFHMLNMLNDRSDPAGYSTDSANAALLAADEGKFLAFHKSLFGSQPEEGARGWSKDQLIALGKSLGLTSQTFADGIRSGKYDKDVSDAFQKVRTTDYLQQEYNGQKSFGTPTLAIGTKIVDTSDPKWLDNAVAAGAGS